MNLPDDAALLRQHFDAACDLPPARREEYLRAHCPDPGLRARVERLLAADAARPGEGGTPDRIGPYPVVRELGRGTYGTVHLARDTNLDRLVAVKVPHPEAVRAAGGIASYLSEARALARLDHPNIVRVYSALEHGDDSCLIVSQYIDGRSLAARLGEGRLGHDEAAGLAAAVAAALQHAHEKGVFHRDVKPANILLDREGRPYLADFGVALRQEEVGCGPRRPGSPAYMSPEQARGEGHRVDGRTDVFSLGVVLFEALTGGRPFAAPSVDRLLDLIANVDAPSPRQRDGTVPDELDGICAKALALRVQDRYRSAGAMADALNAWLRGREQGSGRERAADVRPAAAGSRPRPSVDSGPTPVPVGAPPAGPGPRAGNGTSGSVIGGFELLKQIGRGGMGVVYRAWQPSEQRDVALKCLHQWDAEAQKRFLNEIHALGRVDHPNVVRIYTSGRDGPRLYYAMELVDGADFKALYRRLRGSEPRELDDDTWRDVLSKAADDTRGRERPVAASPPEPAPAEPAEGFDYLEFAPAGLCQSESYVRRVVAVVQQVAAAAQALHDRGLVHRDIKPENIMLAREGGRAVLLDLGIAKFAKGVDGRLTRTRQFVGSLRYASPEQVLDSGQVDRRSDIYSLGVTLWELLALRPIYGLGKDVSDSRAMLRIETEEPEPVRRYNRAVSTDLQSVVQKCLEKNPDRRYQSAAGLADDLGRVLQGQAVTARPIGRLRRTARRLIRRPLVPALCAGLVLMAALAGGLWYLASPPGRDPNHLRVGIKQWVGYTPLAVAQELDLCHPVRLEFVSIDGEIDAAQVALADKKIDVGMWTVDVQVEMQARLAYAKVVLKLDESRQADGFIARTEIDGRPINSIADLQGRPVAWQPTEASGFLLRELCRRKGVDPKKFFDLKTASAEEAANLFLEGRVHAAGTYEPHITRVLEKMGVKARLLTSADDIEEPFIVDVAAVRGEYLATNLNQVRALTRGWFEAVRILTDERDPRHREAIKIACKFNGDPGGVNWRSSQPCEEREYRKATAKGKLRYSGEAENRDFFRVANDRSQYRDLFARFQDLIGPARRTDAKAGDGSQEVLP